MIYPSLSVCTVYQSWDLVTPSLIAEIVFFSTTSDDFYPRADSQTDSKREAASSTTSPSQCPLPTERRSTQSRNVKCLFVRCVGRFAIFCCSASACRPSTPSFFSPLSRFLFTVSLHLDISNGRVKLCRTVDREMR